MNIKQKFLKQLDNRFKAPAKSEPLKHSMASLDYTIPQIAPIIEKNNTPWVLCGENNSYFHRIADLRSGSGIHNAIINTKTKMATGDGWLINGAKNEEESKSFYDSLDEKTKADYDLFINNPNNSESTLKVKEKCADDLETFGAYAYEMIFNNDFTKIVRIKYVNIENIAPSKIENDKIKSYWYSSNWAKQRDNKPVEIFAFDPKDRDHMNQLVYVKNGKGDYFGDIPYKGCLNWIMVDFKMGLFHLSNIDNGMNPGMWFKFYQKPETQEQEQEILQSLVKTYRGAQNASKFVATFSPNRDLAMDIQPIQASNLDKQLLLLAELSDKKILTGHQLTSPLLAGISVSGSLGGNTELKIAFQIFDNIAMAADRNNLDAAFQKVLDFNKVPIKIETNPFDPFKERAVVKSEGGASEALNSLSPLVATKVLETMTPDEIRGLAGLDPLPKTEAPTPTV